MKKTRSRARAAVLGLAASAALLVLGCARQEGQSMTPTTSSTTAGASAADFTARDIDGKTIKLSSHIGKNVVLLDFCSTWCEPCVAEFPHLRRLYDSNKAKGFVILAIAMDGPETVAQVPAFAKRNQLNFPMLTDEDSRIASLYNPKKSAPLSVLIDKSGKIVKIREGYNPGDEDLVAKDVAMALDGTAASQ